MMARVIQLISTGEQVNQIHVRFLHQVVNTDTN